MDMFEQKPAANEFNPQFPAYTYPTAMVGVEEAKSVANITEELRRREKMLDVLNEMDLMLFSRNIGSFDDVMSNSLGPVADVADLDHIVIYRLVDIDGTKRFGQVFRWNKSDGGQGRAGDYLRILPNIPVIEKWLSITVDGGVINTHYDVADEEEKLILTAYGIKSYLLVPVMIDNKPWGGVAFQDHNSQRQFDNGCIGFLSSAARLCANAIIRKENFENLKRSAETLKSREKMLDTLNQASILFLSQRKESFESTMTTGLRLIADMFDLDRISVWRNFRTADCLHTSQIYRWDKDEGGTSVPLPGLGDIAVEVLTPRWESRLAKGTPINSPVSLLHEADMLKSFGIKSVFVSPLIMHNDFWGFVLFEDRRIVRYFDVDSAEMMRSAAHLCASAVVRDEMERDIVEKNIEIRNAMEQTASASRVKSEFLSRMSHEMLTPMNTIIGMMQIMRGKGIPEQLMDYCNNIEAASNHLLQLTNDVLDVSSMEYGVYKLLEEAFNPKEMFADILQVTGSKAHEKRQTFMSAVDPEIPDTLIGDERRMRQVIRNLLANAIKFTQEGGEIRFNVKILNKEEDNVTLQIEVSDNGIGISEKQISKIFTIFEQADGGLSRSHSGIGIGLPLSKRIVDMMHGDMWVESELLKGARFTFTCKLRT